MLQKSNMQRVAAVFFSHPTEQFGLLEISRKLRLAHTSTKVYLEKLAKQDSITRTVQKKGARKYPVYQAAINSKGYRTAKKIHNLQAIIDCGVVEFIEQKLMPKTIVLFGSYQKGEDTEESDIDLYVQCAPEELSLQPFEKKLGRKIQLHFKAEFSLYPKELKNSIINGIVLYGYLEAFP